MRIDFLANYKQVQKMLNSKPSGVTDSLEFEHKLEAQKEPEVVENIEQTEKIRAALYSKEEAPRARFNFPQQPFNLPDLRPEIPEIEIVKEPAQAVKSPTGVKARLVQTESQIEQQIAFSTKEMVKDLVSKAGLEYGIDPKLSMGVIKAESNFNPRAVSSDGFASKGLMQLLDSTGTEMMGRLGIEDNYSPFDPEQNVELGVGYLRRLHDLFSTENKLGGNLKTFAAANSSSLEKLAVAAYNAGEGRVASAQQRASRKGKDPGEYSNIEPYLPEITRQYVSKVMAHRATNDLKARG